MTDVDHCARLSLPLAVRLNKCLMDHFRPLNDDLSKASLGVLVEELFRYTLRDHFFSGVTQAEALQSVLAQDTPVPLHVFSLQGMESFLMGMGVPLPEKRDTYATDHRAVVQCTEGLRVYGRKMDNMSMERGIPYIHSVQGAQTSSDEEYYKTVFAPHIKQMLWPHINTPVFAVVRQFLQPAIKFSAKSADCFEQYAQTQLEEYDQDEYVKAVRGKIAAHWPEFCRFVCAPVFAQADELLRRLGGVIHTNIVEVEAPHAASVERSGDVRSNKHSTP